MTPKRIRGLAVLLVIGALAIMAVVFFAPQHSDARRNPLAGRELRVDDQQSVVSAVEKAQDEQRDNDAKLLQSIADQPQAIWLNGAENDPQQVRAATAAAKQSTTVAVFVVYNIPKRDACTEYSRGGATGESAYQGWLSSVAGAVVAPAIFIVEPDALGDVLEHCLKSSEVQQRYRWLQAAIRTFKSTGSFVYMDATNPEWFDDPSVMVAPLIRAGVDDADGVAVNVSNFVDTARATQWSQQLLAALQSKGFRKGAVIDTSRNGNGAYTAEGDDGWCNPPGRALGNTPTTATGMAGIDAFLWVKPPGESDGSCHDGQPPAGEFWEAYALGLARGNSP